MNSSTYYSKIQKIADTYGYDAQSRQCIEEMAELTQAINKFWRKDLKCGQLTTLEVPIGSPQELSIIEEIADVQIMLWKMAPCFSHWIIMSTFMIIMFIC